MTIHLTDQKYILSTSPSQDGQDLLSCDSCGQITTRMALREAYGICRSLQNRNRQNRNHQKRLLSSR